MIRDVAQPHRNEQRDDAIHDRNEVPFHLLPEMIWAARQNLWDLEREYKRRMAQQPPVECASCGTALVPGIDGFTKVRSLKARYCSNACRQRAYRRRTAAA